MFIDVLKIKKSYKTGDIKLDVLKDVSMDLDRENIGVILGPSGSGKSTLLNIIGGVDKADSGKVTIDGVNITGLDDNKLTEYRRDSIGFVFPKLHQGFHSESYRLRHQPLNRFVRLSIGG